MGVTFRGNPYDQDYDYDSDWEINTDEEWVLPANDIIGTADRNNILFITADDEDSDIFDITNDNDEDTNPDDDDDEDYIPEDDNGSYSPDEDDDYNPDNENYPEYDEVQNFIATQEDNYVADISDDEDDELDYVTYPIAVVSPQPNKTNDNNSLRDASDNDC